MLPLAELLAKSSSGQQYDLHPLDMVVPSTSDSKTCVGSFIPMSLPIAEGELCVHARGIRMRS